MTTPLIITPGKHYRTRDGRKAFVGFFRNGVWVGYVENDGCTARTWTESGAHGTIGRFTLDLLTEWIDAPVVPWEKYPAWFKWVAMDEDGFWFGYAVEPSLRAQKWMGIWYEIPMDHAPTFTGPWRDSLVQRPSDIRKENP